jgi:hypothetical protein
MFPWRMTAKLQDYKTVRLYDFLIAELQNYFAPLHLNIA